jgi:hypothetical protein
LIDGYERKFGWGDEIADTFAQGKWGKNPAKKQCAKIGLNSGWGKHAQRPIMPTIKVVNNTTEISTISDFFHNIHTKTFTFQDMTYLGADNVMLKYMVDGPTISPDLHNSYLPAACFVPAYGRLQLEAQLFPLGKRVLMNDTDSIIYHYIPGQYNIPEGDFLGDWEVEDVDRDNGGLTEFVGLGPKTYAYKCANGYTSVRAKGISLKYATESLVNFDSMKSVALALLPTVQPAYKRSRLIRVPQTSFVWNPTTGMKTYKFLKDLKIDPTNMKGYLENGRLYPYGYAHPQ